MNRIRGLTKDTKWFISGSGFEDSLGNLGWTFPFWKPFHFLILYRTRCVLSHRRQNVGGLRHSRKTRFQHQDFSKNKYHQKRRGTMSTNHSWVPSKQRPRQQFLYMQCGVRFPLPPPPGNNAQSRCFSSQILNVVPPPPKKKRDPKQMCACVSKGKPPPHGCAFAFAPLSIDLTDQTVQALREAARLAFRGFRTLRKGRPTGPSLLDDGRGANK